MSWSGVQVVVALLHVFTMVTCKNGKKILVGKSIKTITQTNKQTGETTKPEPIIKSDPNVIRPLGRPGK